MSTKTKPDVRRRVPQEAPPRTVDSPLTLAAAGALPQLAVNGRPLNPSTIFRWAKRGTKRRKDGKVVMLEVRWIGQALTTTEAAVNRYLRELNDEHEPAADFVASGAAAAERELASAGIA